MDSNDKTGSSADTFLFENGAPEHFSILVDSRIDRRLMERASNRLRSALAALRRLLPTALGGRLHLRAPSDEQVTSVANPADYGYAGVQGVEVDLNGSRDGSYARVTVASEVSPQNFFMQLTHLESGRQTLYGARLTGELPPGCDVYRELALGRWTDGSGNIQIELFADGTGLILGPDRNWNMSWSIASAEEPMPSPWSNSSAPYHPLGVEPGCILYDSGFWHYAFDGLVRSNLQIPLAGFSKYDLGGPFGWPSEGHYFGFDLGTLEPSVTYIKQ